MPAVDRQRMKRPPRGLRSDGEATRTRILEAAGELFATKGYAESSNKAIATLAQVDLASINYHFGNRSGLYQTVLTEAYSQLINIADLRRLVGSEVPPATKLRVLIEQVVERATQEPRSWQSRVLAREVLSPTSHLQTLFQDEALPKMALLMALFSQITQIPKEDPALIRCLLSVMAPCLMLMVGGRSLPGPCKEVSQMPSKTVVDHLYHFAMGGLAAISQEYAEQAEA